MLNNNNTCSFSTLYRLQKADDYSSVFAFKKKLYGSFFNVYYRPNGLSHSRLGFMVSRKVHKRAHRRNYMKRFLREYFRTHQALWLSHDLIIRVQRPFTANEYKQAVNELELLMQRFKINAK